MKKTRRTKKEFFERRCKAFSLVESLIVVFIFSLVILSSISVFSSIVGSRKKVKEIQANMEESRTIMDTMAKEMRMSSYLKGSGDEKAIYFYNNSQNLCLSYKFDETVKVLKKAVFNPGTDLEICSKESAFSPTSYFEVSSVKLENGFFHIKETSLSSNPKVIGRVTISFSTSDANFETSVSFRDYQEIIQ